MQLCDANKGCALILAFETRAVCEKDVRVAPVLSRTKFAVLRAAMVLLISCAAVFFGAFAGSAQAHEMHQARQTQLVGVSQQTFAVNKGHVIARGDVATRGDSVQNAAETNMKACGLNCCSMSGCGYGAQRVAALFYPDFPADARKLLSALPWVKNPLDFLQRPPRASA